MSNQINYKQKYQELKMKFMESVDAAFRIGFEQGAQQAAQDQMMQQQQQQAEMEAQAMAGQQAGAGDGADFGANGAEGSQPGAEQMANPNGEPDSQNPAGSELDQHIEKLESMLKSDEKDGLVAAIANLKGFSAKLVQAAEMKKSYAAIPKIAQALHKPAFKMSKQASHNMNDNAKAAVTMQHKIVSDIMKSWDEEESKAGKDIKQILNIEGLAKKEK